MEDPEYEFVGMSWGEETEDGKMLEVVLRCREPLEPGMYSFIVDVSYDTDEGNEWTDDAVGHLELE